MDTHFDVLVLGTGLTESITAAALAKAGFKVAHVDQNAYYGADQASLSHEELLQWSQSPPTNKLTSICCSSHIPLPFSRSYSISLAPALIPSTGPLISALILSGVYRYGQFKLLDAVYIYRHGALHRVPGSKEDVFKARDISLVDKRKLMRFLQYAAGEFEDTAELEGQQNTPLRDFMREKFFMGEEMCEAILYALAYCSSPADATLPALVCLRQYLRSAGRYGNSPFLVGHYGGLGELAQGFCRTCAVKGGVYILGRKILSWHPPSETDIASGSEASRATIQLEKVPDVLTADFVITSSDYLPLVSSSEPQNDTEYACCIAITDRPLSSSASPPVSAEPSKECPKDASSTKPGYDTAVGVFPPGSLQGGEASNAVRVLQMGEGTLSCPKEKYVLYLWTRADATTNNTPEELLRPYLSALVSSSHGDGSGASHIDFSLFYMRRENKPPPVQHPRMLVVQPLPSSWPDIADIAAKDAEDLFWAAVKGLGAEDRGDIQAFWPPSPQEDEDENEEDW